MRHKTLLAALVFLFCHLIGYGQQIKNVHSQHSPDKQLWCYIRVKADSGIDYRVVYKGQELVKWSPMGLVLAEADLPGTGVRVTGTSEKITDTTFNWPFGENATIRDHYRQLTISFQQIHDTRFSIITRVFDHNLAFRYQLALKPGASPVKILKEKTAFVLDRSYTAYRHNQESVISPTPINALKNPSDFPLVLASPGMFLSINEADNENYTKAVIGKGTQENTLSVMFGKDTVIAKANFYTPWRTLSIAESAIALCNNSDLLYKLCNGPATPVNLKQIQPGKLIRDMTLTTKGAMDCIDFAQKMNFQYIMFDAGWYGKGYAAEFDSSSHPRNVLPTIDMPGVIKYGKEKNIGLILYVNYVGLRKYDMDSSFALYKGWGVKGLKFGFVNGLTQDGISWLMGAVKKAQDYGFIIDVHDNYKPTGLSRTYPAWLTQEGVRGNENNPDAFHNTTLPFTRFLSGAADYTFCYRNQNDSFNNTLLSKKLQVSKAQQMALTVIFYSPLQSMLWYGRPADYQIPSEIEFFKYIPTTWDKTIHLKGEIGEYISVARKKGGVWFIGTAAGDKPYSTTIKLDFLDKGKKYTAFVYDDDGKGGVAIRKKEVDHNSVWNIAIAAKGGQAVRILQE